MGVLWPFLTIPWVCLQYVIVVFPDYTQFLTRFSLEYLYLIGTFTKLSCLNVKLIFSMSH